MCCCEDKIVKLWDYKEGICNYRGISHTGGITKIAIAANQSFFVSTGSERGIFNWKTPEVVLKGKT